MTYFKTNKSVGKLLIAKSLAILCFVILFGLVFINCSGASSSPELTPESLVGTWILDSSSQSLILNGEKTLKGTRLILSADNSFELIDIPHCWVASMSECTNNFNSSEGSWKLYKSSDGRYTLHLNMNNSNNFRGIEILTGAEFFTGNRTIQLDFIAGDPDLGRNTFVFIKQKN